jgi:hypothetical protein
VVVGDGVAAPGYVEGQVPNLPIIAFTNHCPVTLDVVRNPVLALNSRTPFSGRPNLIASRAYNVRGILIDREDFIA